MVAYLIYFIFSDYTASRQNQLALYFEDFLNGQEGTGATIVERSPGRVVLIMYRGDGCGGIQGIVLDTFYMNRDGKIASEFYVITDADEGELKKIDDYSIKKLEDYHEIQKVFYQYFLKDPPVAIAAKWLKSMNFYWLRFKQIRDKNIIWKLRN